MTTEREDQATIRELLESWVIWRDSGDWERFATVWHDDGRMIATWFQAGAADFIQRCRHGFDQGMMGLHAMEGTSIELNGARALAQSRMRIVQRGQLDDVEVDVICHGRFVDALEKRNDRWGIVLRHPIYEMDRLVTLESGVRLVLDQELLRSFPVGYCHLAYLQTRMGFTVRTDLPGTRGRKVATLLRRMRAWLADDGAADLALVQ